MKKNSEKNIISKCYIFSEDTIEYLEVDLSWKFKSTAQKQWILIKLAIPKLNIEPSFLPLNNQLVIGGGEMMPGMLNFMMFGVGLFQ